MRRSRLTAYRPRPRRRSTRRARVPSSSPPPRSRTAPRGTMGLSRGPPRDREGTETRASCRRRAPRRSAGPTEKPRSRVKEAPSRRRRFARLGHPKASRRASARPPRASSPARVSTCSCAAKRVSTSRLRRAADTAWKPPSRRSPSLPSPKSAALRRRYLSPICLPDSRARSDGEATATKRPKVRGDVRRPSTTRGGRLAATRQCASGCAVLDGSAEARTTKVLRLGFS